MRLWPDVQEQVRHRQAPPEIPQLQGEDEEQPALRQYLQIKLLFIVFFD